MQKNSKKNREQGVKKISSETIGYYFVPITHLTVQLGHFGLFLKILDYKDLKIIHFKDFGGIFFMNIVENVANI